MSQKCAASGTQNDTMALGAFFIRVINVAYTTAYQWFCLQVTTTIFMNDTVLLRPRSGVFDAENKDILYITHRRKVSMYNFATNEVTLLSGKQDLNKVFDQDF